MSNVLIIDDDVILSGLFQDYLEEEKFQVRRQQNDYNSLYTVNSIL